ncbi:MULTISPECIES: isoprenylcysteine carboxyl methyltransferase family protein [Rhizobium]|nr:MULTISPECIES: isoprenylcysteine carboxylmethyltransferase family protein [Rhizobium]
MMSPAIILLSFVTLQRLAELALARRNTDALLRKGGHEVGARHYPLMVTLHALWLAGLWLLAPGHSVNPIWLVIFCLLQAGRIWVIASLGERWTTRIVILPGTPLVQRGPYRFMSHPNYAIVAGEIATLPLTFGLPFYALGFSLLNALMLRVRIAEESTALKRECF